MTNNNKPSRKEMIDAIYEKIARKDLSFGCRIFHKVGNKRGFEGKIITSEIKRDDGIFYGIVLKTEKSVTWLPEKNMIIIGHPVMIGDVMDWFGEKTIDMCWLDSACAIDIREGKNSLDLFHFWKNKRKPIEEQPDDCIEFIYDLISE